MSPWSASGGSHQHPLPLRTSCKQTQSAQQQTQSAQQQQQTPQRKPPGLSKNAQKALIILFVVAIVAGFIIWFIVQGNKLCSKQSQNSCNNSSESMQCKHSSPSFDNCCKCNGGNSSGEKQSSDHKQSGKSDNDHGKCHQS